MNYIGIDIGSTCAKTVVLDEGKNIIFKNIRPTGWSSVDTAEAIRIELCEKGYLSNANEDANSSRIVATGYGRISVPFSNKTVTEITCHAVGAAYIYNDTDFAVIDIGGQDTKIISVEYGMVKDFVMNDKCSAGTGRFLEIMAQNLSIGPAEICELARTGSGVKISSMCTVFAESEVISLIGRGESKENIAFGVVDSIAEKVASQCSRLTLSGKNIYLTGGLCECAYLKEVLSDKLKAAIASNPDSRYAGAIGAALTAIKLLTK